MLTLGHELANPPEPTFADVGPAHWAYRYVETVKPFMAGSRDPQSGLAYFRPAEPALREVVAATIVNALGMEGSPVDLKVLDSLPDKDSISPGLRGLVAIAVSKGLMRGTASGFEPQKPLTRAEACVLLLRVLEQEASAPAH